MNDYLDINVPELRPETVLNDGDIQTAIEVVLFGQEVLNEGIVSVYGDDGDTIIETLWSKLGELEHITAGDLTSALETLYTTYKAPIDYILNTYLKHERHIGNTNLFNFIGEVLTVIEDIMEDRAYEIWESNWREVDSEDWV